MNNDYERWFREQGQFIPPRDSSNDLERFKQWGECLFSIKNEEISDLEERIRILDEDKITLESSRIEAETKLETITNLLKTL